MKAYGNEFDSGLGTQIIVFLVCAIIFFFLLRGKWIITMDSTIFFIALSIFIWTIGHTATWYSRYMSPQVNGNNVHGSIYGKPDVVDGKWCVFNLGEITWPFHVRGKLASLVVPSHHVTERGRNYDYITRVAKTNLEDLPESVQDYLWKYEDDYNQDTIYFGVLSEEKFLEGIDAYNDGDVKEVIQDLVEENKRLNNQINLRSRMLQRDYDLVNELANLGDRLNKSKHPILEFFTGKRKKEEVEE